MSEKNDDSIENFFRKAVRQHDTTFEESDWQKMEKMLDAQAAAKPVSSGTSIKRIAIVFTGVLLLSLVTYFVFDLAVAQQSDSSSLLIDVNKSGAQPDDNKISDGSESVTAVPSVSDSHETNPTAVAKNSNAASTKKPEVASKQTEKIRSKIVPQKQLTDITATRSTKEHRSLQPVIITPDARPADRVDPPISQSDDIVQDKTVSDLTGVTNKKSAIQKQAPEGIEKSPVAKQTLTETVVDSSDTDKDPDECSCRAR
jgi:hypothetical protein